ncbi:hypothetical protein RUM43_009449 [Polyplax serrata]|uniref:G-protein coupled receptors family 2 profile 2 domain-containing protein n=1 Tax=Polyplax serrata TaxID=468196 RepID=A0AAN8S8J4_POLSC
MLVGHGPWLLLVAFVTVFRGGGVQCVGLNETDSQNVDWHCGTAKVRNKGITDESAKRDTGSAKKHYTVEYTDYGDVPNFRKLGNGHFDYYNFFGGNGTQKSESVSVVVNKCCSWNSYFDVVNFNCKDIKNEFLNKTVTGIPLSRSHYGSASSYVFVESVPNCGNGSVLSVQIVPRVQVDESGIVLDTEYFSRYCLDENPNYPNQTVVLTCRSPNVFCQKKACFRKCCPLKQSYDQMSRKCQETNRPFNPEFFELPSLRPNVSVGLRQFGLYLGDACEKRGKYLLEQDEGELSYLDSTGTLYVPLYKKCFNKDDFCVEHVKLENFSGIGSFLCFAGSSAPFENSHLQYLLLSLGLIISSMFLLITFFVYLFSQNSQKLYGKSLMCYIACLFTAYLSLAVVELNSTELSKTICIYMGYIILFSFLAAFFWLNVISFDIWKTFRTVRSLDKPKTKKSRKIRFLWYSLYAWVFPCVITASCAVVNQMPNFPFDSIKPDIGEDNCWFSRQKMGIYVFFIAPISLLIICNIVFYIQTAWRIWKVKSDVAKMGKQKRKRFTANKDQFLINGKLFIVMGITWSLEIISFFVPHPIWYISDTANALHGVFIFAVFVLKKKIYQQMSQRLRHPLKNMKKLSTPNPAKDIAIKDSQNSSDKGKSQTEQTGTGNSGSESNT